MLMGTGRKVTHCFSKTTATKFSFYVAIVSRYLVTGQSEIVLGKTHPIVLKVIPLKLFYSLPEIWVKMAVARAHSGHNGCGIV